MTNHTEVQQFDPVPIMETGELVKGTVTGTTNRQMEALVNRTAYLKREVDNLPVPQEVVDAAIAAHVAGDDHTNYLTDGEVAARYITKLELGQPNGAATLDVNNHIPEANLPPVIPARKVSVANEAARLALPVWGGLTIAYQTDNATAWFLDEGVNPSVAGNWDTSISVGMTIDAEGGVTEFEVNGRHETGNYIPADDDYTADQITETASRVFVTPAERAEWNGKQEQLVSGENIKSINGVSVLGSGNIVLANKVNRRPTPVSPLNGNTTFSHTGTLVANGFANLYEFARQYREFEVDVIGGDFSVPVASGQIDADSWALDTPLTILTEYKWRCRDVDINDDASDWSDPQAFTVSDVYVQTPSVTFPAGPTPIVNRSTQVLTSAFVMMNAADTHVASYWELKDNAGTVIYTSGRDETRLTAFFVPGSVVTSGQDYTLSVRYESSSGLLSAWSEPYDFTTGDYSYGKYLAAVSIYYPYLTVYGKDVDTFDKLTGVPAMSAANYAVAMTADANYMAVGDRTAPYLSLLKRTGDTFAALTGFTNPTNPINEATFSADGTYLVLTPDYWDQYVDIYKREGDVFTKLPNLAIGTIANPTAVAFSPDATYLAIGGTGTPYLGIFKREGDTFTRLADPDVLNGAVNSVAFTPDGMYLIALYNASPSATVYKRNGDVFTKLLDLPGFQTTSNVPRSVSISPNGNYVAIAQSASPYIVFYKREGEVYTKLANPSVLPSWEAFSIAFSPDSDYVAVGTGDGAYLMVYKRTGDAFAKLPDPPESNAFGAPYQLAWGYAQ